MLHFFKFLEYKNRQNLKITNFEDENHQSFMFDIPAVSCQFVKN